MAQATFSVRMDENLKKQFDTLCSDFGMNMSTAINIFAKAVVRERRIPFEISSPKTSISMEEGRNAFLSLKEEAIKNNLTDINLDEINEIISDVRKDRIK